MLMPSWVADRDCRADLDVAASLKGDGHGCQQAPTLATRTLEMAWNGATGTARASGTALRTAPFSDVPEPQVCPTGPTPASHRRRGRKIKTDRPGQWQPAVAAVRYRVGGCAFRQGGLPPLQWSNGKVDALTAAVLNGGQLAGRPAPGASSDFQRWCMCS
jgi:hypothetical protein